MSCGNRLVPRLPGDAPAFHAITAWHSLEHVHNPLELLTKIRDRLERDGVLLLAIPNNQSLQSRVGGRRWLHLDVPRHLVHFDERSLTMMLRRAGLRVKKRFPFRTRGASLSRTLVAPSFWDNYDRGATIVGRFSRHRHFIESDHFMWRHGNAFAGANGSQAQAHD